MVHLLDAWLGFARLSVLGAAHALFLSVFHFVGLALAASPSTSQLLLSFACACRYLTVHPDVLGDGVAACWAQQLLCLV
jgi:hypothetical protein